jgi:riboflavin transporter FmnP
MPEQTGQLIIGFKITLTLSWLNYATKLPLYHKLSKIYDRHDQFFRAWTEKELYMAQKDKLSVTCGTMCDTCS